MGSWQALYCADVHTTNQVLNTSWENMSYITVIVIAQNEEPNIRQCLHSVVGWATQVFVVDSFSTDRTPELARACGAEVVQHEFVDFASQREWALANLPLSGEWIFFLDADEVVPRSFKQELEGLLEDADANLAGIYVHFAFYFLGHELKHAYESPPVMRIVRPGLAKWSSISFWEYCTVNGDTTEIREKIIHRDQKSLSTWIEKQNRYASREAEATLQRRNNSRQLLHEAGQTERAWRIWLRNAIYDRLPLVVRPFCRFLYRYILRLGFLDGLPGFAYCFLQGFWYPLLVDLKLIELRQRRMKP